MDVKFMFSFQINNIAFAKYFQIVLQAFFFSRAFTSLNLRRFYLFIVNNGDFDGRFSIAFPPE